MERKEKYLIERDKAHGLLYYDGWDCETSNGVDLIKDSKANVEEEAIQNLLPDIWTYVAKIGDKYHICQFIASGKTEKEIAKICGVSQQSINEAKIRLLKKLREIVEKTFKNFIKMPVKQVVFSAYR